MLAMKDENSTILGGKAKLMKSNLRWNRSWRAVSTEGMWEYTFLYVFGETERELCYLDISAVLSSICVAQAEGYREKQCRNKVYSYFPDWTRAPTGDEDGDDVNYDLIIEGNQIDFDLRPWWSWIVGIDLCQHF
ncbi:hypothetical protein QBC40DRAFT_293878 [Triangularia verruculosa]|uniref:Uncharacterized protein n=1 Tax=Triangularia verruculosa TaxID=2587418 RepID=A0AAN7AW51_9PEZI|nr:hypothetical protein QBC40DRAFT_293878 [Triangularia verruculosa]